MHPCVAGSPVDENEFAFGPAYAQVAAMIAMNKELETFMQDFRRAVEAKGREQLFTK